MMAGVQEEESENIDPNDWLNQRGKVVEKHAGWTLMKALSSPPPTPMKLPMPSTLLRCSTQHPELVSPHPSSLFEEVWAS